MPEETAKKSPHDILRIVLRRWRLFVLSFSLFAIAVMFLCPFLPPLTRKYTSTAKITRTKGPTADRIIRDDVERLQLTIDNELIGQVALKRIVFDTELNLLKGVSRDQDGELTDRVKKEEQEILQRLRQSIRIVVESSGRNADVVRVEVTHRDPDLAAGIVNKLIRNYKSTIMADMKNSLVATKKTLKTKVDLAMAKVADLVKEKVELETENARMRLDRPGALQLEIDRITSSLEAERRRERIGRQALARLESELQTIRASTTQPSSTTTQSVQSIIRENPELRRLRSDLQKYQDLLEVALRVNHMTEKHPDVIALRARIEVLEKRIEQTPETETVKVYSMSDPANPDRKAKSPAEAVKEQAVSDRREELDMATTEIDRLEERRKQLESAMSRFASVRRKYEAKLEELKYEREKLARWQKQLEEVEVALGSEVLGQRTKIKLQLAQRQFRPSSPKLTRVLGLALIGGLAFGGGLVFLSNLMDRTIGTTEDAMKYFALPVHGVIGEITTPRDRLRKRIRNWVLSPIVALILGCCLLVGVLNVYLWLRVPEYKGGKFVVDFLYQNVQALIPG